MNTATISRRTLLQTSAAASVAAMMPGAARADTGGTIRIMGVETAALDDWTEYTAETGLKVEFTGINSDPGIFRQEVVANAAGENVDIFLMDGGIEDELGTKGYFMPLDGTKIPGWTDMPEDVRQSPLVTDPKGTVYGVPAVLNADSFAYDADVIDGAAPLSFGLLFDSDKTLGRVGLENAWLTTLPMAATYLKASKGAAIQNPSNMTADEAKLVVDFLIARKKAGQFRALWSSFDESVDMLARKEAIVSNVWEPAVKALQKQGKNYRYAYTVEGYNKWLIGAYVPSQVKDRGTEDMVYKALGGFLGGSYSARIAVLRGYATGRPELGLEYAKSHNLPADQIADIEANISKINKKFMAQLFWQNTTPDNLSVIEGEWERFRQA
jgi:putative spermidine/putrescine transport system substrate-binding protein